MPLPKVSIIIPCFNVGETIGETFASALGQTYPNIEIVMVNDGSTDSTLDILNELGQVHDNVIICSHQNRGLPATRNVGFKNSSGDYLVFLDGDDKLAPNYVERCVSEFIKEKSLDLVYTETEFFEAKAGIFELPEYSFRQILIGNCIPATALIKAEYFRDVGMYDESLRITEDWELWIRYLYKYPNVRKISESLFYYRKRFSGDSMTDLNAKSHNIEGDRAQYYIYQKHYSVYREYNIGIRNLFEAFGDEKKIRAKYYNVWYRKWFYKIFKSKKMQS